MTTTRRAAARVPAALAALLASAALLSACSVRETGLTKADLDRFRASSTVKSVRRVPPAFAVHSPWEVTLPVAGVVSLVALPWVPEVTSRWNILESAGGAAADAGGPALGVLSAEGAVAYAAARRRGSAMVAPFRLDDPASAIQDSFLYTLRTTGPGLAEEVAVQPDALPPPTRRAAGLLSRHADPGELQALRGKVGSVYLLDFRTTDWGLLYYTWDWDRYRVRYSASARLLDLTGSGTPKVAWEGNCQVLDDEYDRRPVLEDFFNDNGALLRIRLLDAAEECSRQLWRKFAAAP